MKLHPSIRKLLGYTKGISNAVLLKLWRHRTTNLCKPCWELRYCPYGPLVEDFPLPPATLAETENHNEYLRECLKTGFCADGSKVDSKRRHLFEEDLRSFRKSDYPAKIPQATDGPRRLHPIMIPPTAVIEVRSSKFSVRRSAFEFST
jgi:hypothetical protein